MYSGIRDSGKLVIRSLTLTFNQVQLLTISNTEKDIEKSSVVTWLGELFFNFFVADTEKIKNKASVKLEECDGGAERPRVDEKQQNKFTLEQN